MEGCGDCGVVCGEWVWVGFFADEVEDEEE
jgi:hypothetical protein